jgi:hypothetical protein
MWRLLEELPGSLELKPGSQRMEGAEFHPADIGHLQPQGQVQLPGQL